MLEKSWKTSQHHWTRHSLHEWYIWDDESRRVTLAQGEGMCWEWTGTCNRWNYSYCWLDSQSLHKGCCMWWLEVRRNSYSLSSKCLLQIYLTTISMLPVVERNLHFSWSHVNIGKLNWGWSENNLLIEGSCNEKTLNFGLAKNPWDVNAQWCPGRSFWWLCSCRLPRNSMWPLRHCIPLAVHLVRRTCRLASHICGIIRQLSRTYEFVFIVLRYDCVRF